LPFFRKDPSKYQIYISECNKWVYTRISFLLRYKTTTSTNSEQCVCLYSDIYIIKIDNNPERHALGQYNVSVEYLVKNYVLKKLAIAVLSHAIISFSLVQNALSDLKS
jgi:hypothetical protein